MSHPPIVVGVDFSPASRPALREAERQARLRGAPLHALHVIEFALADAAAAAVGAVVRAYADQLRSQAQATMQHWLAQLDTPAHIHHLVVQGSPVPELLGFAKSVGAGLLVVGAAGFSHRGGGLGTVAASCIRHSPVDVLAVFPEHQGPFSRVVACTDFSPTAERAVREASAVVRADKAQLHVLNVCFPPLPQPAVAYSPFDTGALAIPDLPEYEELFYADRQRAVADVAAAAAADSGCTPTSAVVRHPVYADGICEYARQVNADLLVLGTRGHTNLRDILLGSTAERVLKRLSCSVLAIKPSAG